MSLIPRPGAVATLSGSHESFSYEIFDANSPTSVVKIHIPSGASMSAIPGCMVASSDHILIEGKMKKKMKAMLGPDEARYQTFSAGDAPGWILLAPAFYGSIKAVHIRGEEICVGDDAFLASIGDIETTSVRQGAKVSMFSSSGMFVKKVKGSGIIFVCAVGSAMEVEIAEGENVIVDTGHLVAWPRRITYDIQKASKGWFGTGLSGEGMVSKITGPGKILIQTRNPEEIAQWIYDTKRPPG